ncbi:MAG TPA: hypothetical protein VMK65_01640 [Longimicrobiales bacterium]|nr:hypothetical protein [Longimicrobiales bacterium]
MTIRRLVAEGIPWRVRAEVWPDDEGYAGRLTFEPDSVGGRSGAREGPALLRGTSEGEVLAEAHSLSERRLRLLLHALS